MALLDAVVVGSGPNGLAAAVTLARAGLAVRVLEAESTLGGGARTLELEVVPGSRLRHDICSAVHPMAWASPFLRAFDLPARGVELRAPDLAYAQPLDGGRAGLAYRDIARTAALLDDASPGDGAAWRSLLGPLADAWQQVTALALGDKRTLRGMTRTDLDEPGTPLGDVLRAAEPGLRFGAAMLEQGTSSWNRRFAGDVAPALLTGVAAHAISTLPSMASAGTALLLAALAHAPGGWPLPVGGSQAIVDALVADLKDHGVELETDHEVRSPADLPPARAYLFDTPPGTVARVFADRLAPARRAELLRFPHGHGAAKVDFVLSGPVPWAVPDVGGAATVHLGGTRAQIAAAEADVAKGRVPDRPVGLVSDPTVTDPARERGGLRPLWVYAHVPRGSDVDVTDRVVAQLERFAPGFRDVVVASRCIPAARMAEHNPSLVGGDIAGGAITLWRMIARPAPRVDPYAVGPEGVYLCSQSTPPGPSVHGMCGWFAARRALRREFDIATPPSLAPRERTSTAR